MWFFNGVFSLKHESSSWLTSGTFNFFFSFFQFMIRFYLENCSPYVLVLLLEILSNSLVANCVVLFFRKLRFSARCFSPEKDADSCFFCFICNMKMQFCKYIRSLNSSILNNLCIGLAQSLRMICYFQDLLKTQIDLFNFIWTWDNSPS